MKITCTGHAGLFIESAAGSILCDPWRSPAFFASWFVFPDNADVDFSALRPDYLYISHLHQDHFDRRLLAAVVPKSATVLLPDYPTDDLRQSLSALGFSRFVETHCGEPFELDGLRIMIASVVSPNDGTIGDSALALDDGHVRILNQNDAKPRDLDAVIDFGPYDGHFVQYSGANWWPTAYDLAPATKHALGVRKRANGMERAKRFVDAVGASFVFPNSGPPAFLDESLFSLNDTANDEANPFPDQSVFIDFLKERGHTNARLLIPGSVAILERAVPSSEPEPSTCVVTHPIPDADVKRIFREKERYLRDYASREVVKIEEERQSRPRYHGDLVEALADWWNPLLELADHIGPGVGGPMLIAIGDDQVVIDFVGREVRRWAGEECRYRLTIAPDLVESLLADHEVDWVNSLFLSLRFGASRRGGYNEYIWNFFRCLAPERLSYAEGWYAEQEGAEELVPIGEFLVQRRCPHLKADLARFGTLEDCVLTCGMHGWRFDLATGRCLTSEDHEIRVEPVGHTPG